MAAAAQQELAPWGRLRLTSKKPTRESETLDLRRSVHRIGRLPSKADLVVNRPYISALHCVIELVESEQGEAPRVVLNDRSKVGVYVNGAVVGSGNSKELQEKDLVRITRPGALIRGAADVLAYEFELLPGGFTSDAISKRARDAPQAHRELSALDHSPKTPVATRTRSNDSSLKRKAESQAEEKDSEPPTPSTQLLQDTPPPAPAPAPKRRRVAFVSQDSGTQASQPQTEENNVSQQLAAARAEIEALKRVVTNTETNVAARDVEISTLKTEIRDQQQKLNSTSAKLEECEQKLQTVAKEAAAEKRILNAELTQVKANLESTSTSLDEEFTKNTKLKVEYKSLEAELKETHDKLLNAYEQADRKALPNGNGRLAVGGKLDPEVILSIRTEFEVLSASFLNHISRHIDSVLPSSPGGRGADDSLTATQNSERSVTDLTPFSTDSSASQQSEEMTQPGTITTVDTQPSQEPGFESQPSSNEMNSSTQDSLASGSSSASKTPPTPALRRAQPTLRQQADGSQNLQDSITSSSSSSSKTPPTPATRRPLSLRRKEQDVAAKDNQEDENQNTSNRPRTSVSGVRWQTEEERKHNESFEEETQETQF